MTKISKTKLEIEEEKGTIFTEEHPIITKIARKLMDNFATKGILTSITKRKSAERRIEKLLRNYTGEDVDLSTSDKLMYPMVKTVLKLIGKGFDMTEEELKGQLSQNHWRRGIGSILEGMAWNGVEKPFVPYSPLLMIWHYTDECNLNCDHCYRDSSDRDPDELSTEEAKLAVEKMANAGVGYISFSGGEPLAREDFLEICEHVRDNGMSFSIATNGTLLTEEKMERLEDLNCDYIQISLDGSDAETHNDIRGAKIFDRTLEGIKNGIDSEVTVGIATTVTEKNYGESKEIVDLAEELGADVWLHYNYIPMGRGKKDVDLTPRERNELLEWIAKNADDKDINLSSTAPQFSAICSLDAFDATSVSHFDRLIQEDLPFSLDPLAEFVGGCVAGRLYGGLQPNGDVTPCVFLSEVCGNIMEDDLMDLWKENHKIQEVRDKEKLEDDCESCNFQNICGGCRARAHNYFNDYLEDDIGCILNKEKWEKVKNN